MTLCSSSVEGPKGRRHFNCWLGPSLKAGKPMPSWVYPLVVAWFALGMVANVSQTGMHVTRCMFDITWQFKIVWLQSLHAGDCYPHYSTCLLWSVWLIMCLSVYHYVIFRSVSSWFSLHSLSNASVSVDPGADETAIWLRAAEREVLLAWGLCCCHGTDAWWAVCVFVTTDELDTFLQVHPW